MRPQLYDVGLRGMELLGQRALDFNDTAMLETLSLWPTVFTNVSLIANRETPLHRDPRSQANWFDLLVNVGDHNGCVLSLPSLGVELAYNSGTVVAFSGRLLQHGANAVDGNRYCLTYYMRDNIHRWLNVPQCDWMRVDDVRSLLLPLL